MKYVVIVAMLLMAATAFADSTSGVSWTTPDSGLNSFLNQYATHNHGYDRPDDPKYGLGLGVDVIAYEFEGAPREYGLDSVNVESKWDFMNRNGSTYGVVHVNAWRAVNKLFK